MADNTQATSKPFNYRYPYQKLDSSDDYLKITVLKYVPPGFKTFNAETKDFSLQTIEDKIGSPGDQRVELGSIILPVPDAVATSNGVNWGTSSFNPVQAGVAGLLDSATNLNFLGEAKNMTDAIEGALKNTTTGGIALKALISKVVTEGANITIGGLTGSVNFAQVLSKYAGVIVNPNVEVIFSSITLREPFAFVFDIVPRSKKEAEEIRNIILRFKHHSAAKKNFEGSSGITGLFLGAPDVFKLEYMSGKNSHPYLNKFKICALQSFGVDYTGNATYATYSDGTPVNIKMQLIFQELTPIFAEDQDLEKGGTGY